MNRRRKITDFRLYAGQWVALTHDQTAIIGHSRSLKIALKQAQKTGERLPHMIKSPTEATASFIY